jgi:5-methylthioribose kinase
VDRLTVPAGYAPLDAGSVEAYLDGRPEWRARLPAGPLTIREVGDGNLNLVFIVRSAADPDTPGIVLKQSLPWVRVFGEGWPLTVERAVREARAYEAHAPVAGEALPAYLGFDETRYVIGLEDLGDLRVWRGALNDGEIHLGAASTIGRFVARVAFWTSDFGLQPEERKERLAASSNPELCRITEDLVLTEPYIEHAHNWHHPALDPLVAEIRSDAALRGEVGLLKHAFRTHAEALIHGDLHTGSVMVGGGRTAIIDPEFAFYGPVAFDLGALWANAVIAEVRAARLGRPDAFRAHLASIIRASWDAFRMELERLWPDRADPFLGDEFREAWVRDVWRDAVGFAGTKAIRRMIGFAHVSDIETLEEPDRSAAAAAVVRIGRRLILERGAITGSTALWTLVQDEIAAPVGIAV